MTGPVLTRSIACLVLLHGLAACKSEPAADVAASDTGGMATSVVGASQADSVSAAASAAPAQSGSRLDPNAASRADLLAISGMDAATADELIAARPLTSNAAADKILAKRLSEQQRDTVYARLWSPIDINTASAAEIMLIPGVGPRMRHEFEEYRPYTSMEQFRREIGKYVDEKEVARLESYIVIR